MKSRLFVPLLIAFSLLLPGPFWAQNTGEEMVIELEPASDYPPEEATVDDYADDYAEGYGDEALPAATEEPAASGEAATSGEAAAGPEATPEPAASPEAAPTPEASSRAVSGSPAIMTDESSGMSLERVLAGLATLQTKVEGVSEQVEATDAKVETLTRKVDALAADLTLRLDSLGAVSSTLRSVESDYLASDSLGSWRRLDTSAFRTKLASGFARGESRLGTWVKNEAATSISQKDGSAFFAKWRTAIPQGTDKRLLYSFTAGSSSKEIVGLGIHLSVSGMPDKAKDKAYWGEGKSVLVWFARDPLVKGNRKSWLQIYRSDSEVNLDRVFDSQMEDAFSDMDNMKVDILYDPAERLLIVQVNGSIRVAYKLPFILPAGSEVALRTVGSGCSFSDFAVYTE